MYRHLPVLGDNKGFTWTVQGNVGTIENGVFTASGSIGSGSVTASLGRISVTVPVTVTARALRTLDGFESEFSTTTGTRAMLARSTDMTRVHNGYAPHGLTMRPAARATPTSASTMPSPRTMTSSTSGSTATIAERSSRW